MQVGITGARAGITVHAGNTFENIMVKMHTVIKHVHHGDCKGADEDAHRFFETNYRDIKIVIHPPPKNLKKELRAFCKAHETKKALPTFKQRNEEIVECTNLLIAFAPTKEVDRNSGTWECILHALKLKKPTIIIFKDGSKREINCAGL